MILVCNYFNPHIPSEMILGLVEWLREVKVLAAKAEFDP